LRSDQVLAVKTAYKLVIIILAVSALFGCERRKKLSREEIPAIKETIVAFEQVIKARNTFYFDSVISDDAVKVGTTPESVFDFIYSDGLDEFVGFTQKQIIFRGDAARCDCFIHGPDGPTRPVTITLRKEDDIWLIKKIEPRVNDALKIERDST
jgi:hypothetical protein